MADMFQQLKEDHVNLKNHIEQCIFKMESSNALPSKEKIMDIQKLWAFHMKVEEDCLYPEMQKLGETADLIKECYQEHQTVKKILDDLVKRELTTQLCLSEGKELLDTLNFHIQKEESELFPSVKQYLKKEEIDKISQKVQQIREKELARKV